jgi:hypothetical protein
VRLDEAVGAQPDPLTIEGSEQTIAFAGLTSTNRLDPGDGGAFAKVFELAGLDQTNYRLIPGSLKFSTWQQSARNRDGDRDLVQLFSYSGRFDKTTQSDLEADEAADLLRLATRLPARPSCEADRTRVVIVADAQIGKVDHRGGTAELLARIAWLRDRLEDVMVAEPCADAVILDAGDLIEGFENTKGQKHTNDLSLPSMLRVARGILTDIVGTVASHHGSTRVATVPSNHAAWREGSGYLGKPGDDFGIDTHRAVSEVFAYANPTVGWVWPGDWEQAAALDIRGVRVGLVHGHYAKARRFKDYLAGQTLGSTILADCEIVVSGHFHSYLVEGCGWLNGQERTHVQAPTMDNGSEWWRALTGDDSAPGIVTFTIEGGQIGSLTRIQQRQ